MNNDPSRTVKPVKPILKKKPVLKPPMQPRIFIQIPEYNFEANEYWKNKTKFALIAQYSISFPDKHAKVPYIIIYIKLHIGNDMDKGHYVCDVLYYSIWTWRNCDDDTITQYPGYPMNVYNDLSIDNNKKKENIVYGCIRYDCVHVIY